RAGPAEATRKRPGCRLSALGSVGATGLVIMRLFPGTKFDQPPKCDRCGALETNCACPPLPADRIPPETQTARLAVEKRRKGKVVTIIRGLSAAGNDLPVLLSRLKSHWGAGGTIAGE